MSPVHPTVDRLVIGGGLAGSMVAIVLAEAGLPVTLVEKERAPHHKVCGEFLSREALEYLAGVGISPAALGAAAIRRVRLSSGRHVAETALPFTALSLSRYLLDEALLGRARAAGCEVRRGLAVEKLTPQGETWLAQLGGGASLPARTVFLASGKHDLRGWQRSAGAQPGLIGFKQHWRLAPAQTEALRHSMELFLFPGGYGGLSLIEGDAANLCLVVRRSRLHRLGGWTPLLAVILAGNRLMRQRLEGASASWERPMAISPIPYGYLGGRPENLWCVGDQAAVIPSFTGDGMSIALHSASLAAQCHLAGRTAADYHRELRAQLSRPMALATGLSRAMVAGPGRSVAPLGLALFPGAMRWNAASTRIPEQALLAQPAVY